VFWDGLVLVLVARTRVRTCRCTLGRPPLAGAVLVGRWPLSSVLRWWSPEEVSHRRRDYQCHPRPDLLLFGFEGLSSPLVWGRGRGPFHSGVFPKVIAAAVEPPDAEVVVAAVGAAVAGEPPRVCCPAGPPV
jgi:hypothetical protein